MTPELIENAFHLIATTLNPPVLWLVALLLFVHWKLYKRRGWDLLVFAWLANILYLYNDTFSATTAVFGFEVSQFVGSNLSLATSVLFMGFALEREKGLPRKVSLYCSLAAGLTVALLSLGLARISTGTWRTPFQAGPTPAMALAIMYTPLIVFSALTTISAAIAIRHDVARSQYNARILIVFAWMAYGGLQFAYYTKFIPNKWFIVAAFTAAWCAKVSIAAGLFVLFKDDTELLQARRVEQLAQSRQQLAFSWFAHELKNPIHALQLRAETITAQLNQREYHKAATVAAKLVQTATILTSIIGSLKLAAEPVDLTKLDFFSLNDAINEAIEQVKTALQLESRSIRAELGKGVRICAVRPALVQIFVNLIRNGIEACAELGEADLQRTKQMKMYIDTKRQQAIVRARVVDFGAGVSASIRDTMFEPYYSTREGINRGLGLWVVKTFVETFHGTVSVSSPIKRLGRGTVFELRFPAADQTMQDAVQFFNNTSVLKEPV